MQLLQRRRFGRAAVALQMDGGECFASPHLPITSRQSLTRPHRGDVAFEVVLVDGRPRSWQWCARSQWVWDVDVGRKHMRLCLERSGIFTI